MAKEVNIHVKTPGAETSKQKLDELAAAGRDFGEDVNQAGTKVQSGAKKGAEGIGGLSQETGKAQSGFEKFGASITLWAAKIFGIAAVIRGITTAIKSQTEAMKEHADLANEQQRSLVRLQYLGQFFKEKPELRKEVEAYAEYGRRPFVEVVEAWYNLRSKGAGLSEAQRRGIMQEALEMGRTDPDTELDTLVDMFSLYAKKTGQADINRIQNVLLQTITEAGGSTGDVSRYMPQFLPFGLAGGLTPAQTAGLWSYATTQTADAAVATTGLKAMFLGLQGKGTPEGQELLKQFGVMPQMGFFEKIDLLSQQYQGGALGLGVAEQLAGREGAGILLDLLRSPGAAIQTISNVEQVDTGKIDLTRDMITELTGQDRRAFLEEETRRLDIALENLKGGKLKPMEMQKYLKEFELEARKANEPEIIIKLAKAARWALGAVGFSPETIASRDVYPSEYRDRARDEGSTVPTVNNINNFNNEYHQDMNFYPRVGTTGEGERGPRVSEDIVY